MSKWQNILTLFLLFPLIGMLLTSCSNTKYLRDGDILYTGAKVEFESNRSIANESDLRDQIDEVLSPKPNARLLGLRPSLWIFNHVSEPKKDRGFKYWLKYKIGKPPVLMESVRPEAVSNLIQNRLYNNGYFNSSVTYSIEQKGKRKQKVLYQASLEQPYRLDTITFLTDSSGLDQRIAELGRKSLLERGQAYSLQRFQQERERIDLALKDLGYFYFSGDHLKFSADSTIGRKRLNVFIEPSPKMPDRARHTYQIREIRVYPNYVLSIDSDSLPSNGIVYDNLTFFEEGAAHIFRPKSLHRSIFLQEGENYSRTQHDLTLNRLMGLGAFKFVDVRFEEVGDSSQYLLDAAIYMTPLDKKTLRAELEMVTKSNNFTGPGIEGTWMNRNTFGGAEILQIRLGGGIETQISSLSKSEGLGEYLSYRINAGAELQVPRFLTPFYIRYNSRYVPRTSMKADYELINRQQYFTLNSLSTSFGYSWKPNGPVQHEFDPIAVTFSQLSRTTQVFEARLDTNQFLANSFSEQFIIGPQYTFTYNDQVIQRLRNHIFFSAGADVSNPFSILGTVASTYVRFTSDFRYYFKLGKNSKLASRIYGGIGIPYDHSRQLPYVKQFFAGGPNGVRAFRSRTIGPGTYNAREAVAQGFLDQNGDIKLLFSLEYRFKIYGVFHGALFGDAGNIWLLNQNPDQPGGQLDANSFMSELAVGSGIGARIDLSFFLIRLDVALPLRKPYLTTNSGWVSNPLKERPVFNLAIGYPF